MLLFVSDWFFIFFLRKWKMTSHSCHNWRDQSHKCSFIFILFIFYILMSICYVVCNMYDIFFSICPCPAAFAFSYSHATRLCSHQLTQPTLDTSTHTAMLSRCLRVNNHRRSALSTVAPLLKSRYGTSAVSTLSAPSLDLASNPLPAERWQC
jgi:hypothetical protein